MNLWRSSFFIFMIFMILGSSYISYGQTRDSISYNTDQIKVIKQHYAQSNNDTLSIPQRIHQVSVFLNKICEYKIDSLEYKGLMQKTWLLGRVKSYDSAIAYSHLLYDLATQNNSQEFKSKALLKLGIYHARKDQEVISFKYYNEALTHAKQQNDSLTAGNCLLQMANTQTFLGDYSGGKTTATDGLAYLEPNKEEKNISILSGLYHIISVANRKQNNNKEALRYNQKALALGTDSVARQKIGLYNLLIYKNTRALILTNQGNFKKGLALLYKLAKDSVVISNNEDYARVLSNLGHTHWQENEGYEGSERFLLQGLKLQKEENDVNGMTMTHTYLSKYYFKKNKVKSLHHAQEAYFLAKKHQSLALWLEALGYIFELRPATQAESLEFKKVHHRLEASNQRNREIYAVTKYENDKLSNENLILKAAQLKKERQQVIYFSIGIVLFLLGGILFYISKQKHKREKIREVYEAETRISKKLHDELANDVYHVMTQIQNKQQTPNILDKLEQIYNTTRNISREHNSFSTGDSYERELEAMLSSYGNSELNIFIKGIDSIPWSTITPEKKIIIHRSLQELMVNMKKYSKTSIVVLTFSKSGKGFVITYADTGIGASAEDLKHSNGLKNTENRINGIKGSFNFVTQEGKGFKASLYIPS